MFVKISLSIRTVTNNILLLNLRRYKKSQEETEVTKAEIKKKIVEMLIQEYKKQDWKEVPEDIFIPVSRFIEEIGVSNYRITRAMEELVQERVINRNCKNQGGGKFYYLYDFLKENYVEMPENMDSDKNLNLNLLNIEELHNDYEV